MKYSNLFFCLFFSLLSGITMQDFTKRIALCSCKKFSQIKDYGKKLKTDMRDFKCNVSGIKKFALAHPFIAAKVSQELLGSLLYIITPMVYCDNKDCHLSASKHFINQSKLYFFLFYREFFNFIFKFNDENDEYGDSKNFFSNSYPKKNIRLIFFPILTSLANMYALFRTKPPKTTAIP